MSVRWHLRLGDDVLRGADDGGVGVVVVGVCAVGGGGGGEEVDAHERRVEQREAHAQRVAVGGHQCRQTLGFAALVLCTRTRLRQT